MDNYDYVDAYFEFVPMLYEAASSSEYYKWEDAIINFCITGDVPLNQLANLAKRGLSPSVFFGCGDCSGNMVMTIALLSMR